MSPAISSSRRLTATILLLGVLLLLPVILALTNVPKPEMYRGVTREAGSFAFMGHEFFEEKGDIDMLFFGASLLRAAIDGPAVEQALSSKLGRPAKVLVCGVNWAGMDIQYFLLRDLLEHRKVSTVVLSIPVGQQDTSMPHVQLYRMLRFGDYPDAFAGLKPQYRAAMYGAMVLGAPRQALNSVRSNLLGDEAEPDETPRPGRPRYDEIGYYGALFVRDSRKPPAFQQDELRFSKNPSAFRFVDKPLSGYHMHFLLRIAELMREKGVKVIFLNLPVDADRGNTLVTERMLWTDYFGPHASILGVSSAKLFQGFSEDEFYRFYYDQHLNRNGREYFTTAVLPALLSATEAK